MPVMAVNHDRCAVGQLILAQRDKVHRDMDMPGQRAIFHFLIFADIKQEHRFVFMQPLMQFGRGELGISFIKFRVC